MTTPSQRTSIVSMINRAVTDGARRAKACSVIGISLRTLQRWSPNGCADVRVDQRPLAARLAPKHQLSQAERERIVAVCNQSDFASLPPNQIVPRLADAGQYLASESTFYRVLRAAGQLNHRGRSRKPVKRKRPTTFTATQPNQVWTWDITYLPSTVRGPFFYLCMVQDPVQPLRCRL